MTRVRVVGVISGLVYMATMRPEWLGLGAVQAVFALGAAYTAIIGWLNRYGPIPAAVSILTPAIDTALVATGCAATGGVTSELRYFLFVVPLTAAVRVGPLWTLAYSAIIAAAYAALSVVVPTPADETWQIALVVPILLLLGFAGALMSRRVERWNEALEYEVADTGIGIPPEVLPRLAEKFYQVASGATREYGGTGLGLAIAKAIVEAHNGAIQVDSAPGAGSRFAFTLPLAGPAAQQNDEAGSIFARGEPGP